MTVAYHTVDLTLKATQNQNPIETTLLRRCISKILNLIKLSQYDLEMS